jgi:hypothetical protein
MGKTGKKQNFVGFLGLTDPVTSHSKAHQG